MSNATDVIKPLSENKHQVFISNSVQLYDTLEVILQEVGPCHIMISSFSISEEFIRKINRFHEKGKLLSSLVLVDHKASAKVAKLLPFASNVFNQVYLGNNHSKVILLWNDEAKKQIAVVTSQNLTRGNRNESTFITSDPQLFGTLLADLSGILKQSIVVCSQQSK